MSHCKPWAAVGAICLVGALWGCQTHDPTGSRIRCRDLPRNAPQGAQSTCVRA
jgi:hypothetical protein